MAQREKRTSRRGRTRSERIGPGRILLSLITTILVAASLVGAGLFVCSADFTTKSLSENFSRWEGSGFSSEQLTEAALAAKDYTVGTNDRNELFDELESIFGFSASPDLLDKEVLSHLDDVYKVVNTARIAIMVIAACALALCLVIFFSSGKALLGVTLRRASFLVLVPFLCLALWSAVDFNGFFAAFHSLFFADGSWLFDADSLLIRMYPTPFWIGMGVVWLCTTFICCLLCFILGKKIQGKKRL